MFKLDEKFEQLIFKSDKIKYIKEKRTLKQVIKNLRDLKLEVFSKELTTPDIKSTKIRVFRVIVPGLVDLNKSHLLPREGARRLWEVPDKLKLKTKKRLSRLPHPFP